jgi:hypothetical protein
MTSGTGLSDRQPKALPPLLMGTGLIETREVIKDALLLRRWDALLLLRWDAGPPVSN